MAGEIADDHIGYIFDDLMFPEGHNEDWYELNGRYLSRPRTFQRAPNNVAAPDEFDELPF